MDSFLKVVITWKKSWEKGFRTFCRYFGLAHLHRPVPKTEGEAGIEVEEEEDYEDRFHLLVDEPLEKISRPIEIEDEAEAEVNYLSQTM